MRILEIVPEWPPNVIGGGGAVYRQIALRLGQRHRVTVAHGDYTNRRLVARSRRELSGPLELITFPLVPTPPTAGWLRTALPPVMPAFSTLFKLIAQGWDVAHLHGMCMPMIDAAAAALRRRKIPYVFTLHGVPASPLHRGYLIRNAYLWYARTFSARTILGATSFTAVSRSLLTDPLIPRREGRVIYNGLSDEDFESFRDHQVVADTPVIVSLSRLSTNKGIDIAIEAVSLLITRGKVVRYDVYGPDGGERLAFERLALKLGVTDRVRFLGPFEAKDRSRVLGSADVVVVPSRVEGFGISALEAVAAGVPVVASRVDGLAEYLRDDAAVLVPPEDADALAFGIEKALQRPLRDRLIESGRELATQHKWDRILSQYEEVLTRAAAFNCAS